MFRGIKDGMLIERGAWNLLWINVSGSLVTCQEEEILRKM